MLPLCPLARKKRERERQRKRERERETKTLPRMHDVHTDAQREKKGCGPLAEWMLSDRTAGRRNNN